jgi:hypothetical protein
MINVKQKERNTLRRKKYRNESAIENQKNRKKCRNESDVENK